MMHHELTETALGKPKICIRPGRGNLQRLWVRSHCLLIALVPLSHLLEGMYRRTIGPLAMWLELLVLDMVSIPLGLAGSILRHAHEVRTSHTVLVHARLGKEILAHRAILAVLDAHLPVDGVHVGFAIVDMVQQCCKRSLREQLEISEESIVHMRAIHIVTATLRLVGNLQRFLQTCRDEDCVRVNLNYPIKLAPFLFSLDLPPDITEDPGVHVSTRCLAFREPPIAVTFNHLRECPPVAAEGKGLVAEEVIAFALEDAQTFLRLVVHQLQFLSGLWGASVDHDHCKAVQRLGRHHLRLCEDCLHALRTGELRRVTPLHTLRFPSFSLEACETLRSAATTVIAIFTCLGTLCSCRRSDDLELGFIIRGSRQSTVVRQATD